MQLSLLENTVPILLVLLGWIIIPVGFDTINVYAQSQNGENIPSFRLYENPDYNIKIQHPRNWEKSEQDLPANTIVQFIAPETKDVTQPAGLLISSQQITNGTTLDEFIDIFFNDRYSEASGSTYKLVSSFNSTLAGMAAKEFVVYDYDNSPIPGFGTSTIKVMRTFAVNDKGNGYMIKYWAEPGLFDKYRPTAEKMLGSFVPGNESFQTTVSNVGAASNESPSKTVSEPEQIQNEGTKLLRKWGSSGGGDGQFREPADLAVDPSNGLIYVADLSNNRIQKFDTNGKFLSKWGSFGSEDAQFNHPGDVAVSPWGEIFVADLDNSRIQKFDSNSTFLSKWGTAGIDDGQFNHPGDIAFDPKNRSVFVIDTDNNRVQIFDSNGTFIDKWGSLGTGNGEFNQPAGLSFDELNGFLYVADTKNDRIQKFDTNGTFISKWGVTGAEQGEFNRPTSAVVDPVNKVVYVADTNNQRVQMFDLEGKFIMAWGSQGIGDGQFNRPSGIAFDTPNTVYVTDKENNVVQVFIPSTMTTVSESALGNKEVTESEATEPSTRVVAPVDMSKIPDTLTLTTESEDNDFPLVATIDRNGGIRMVDEIVNVLDLKFEVDDWNPKLTFQFVSGSESGLVNVKQVLIGKIKSYSNSQKALTSALLWKEIPLNQEVVLKIKENGLNYAIVQVQFSNGATGLYSGAIDVKPNIDDKSFYSDTLRDDLRNNKGLKVIRSITPKIGDDETFYQVAGTIVCDDLTNSGFRTCE